MNTHAQIKPFAQMNRAYGEVFQPGRLTLGLVIPLEAYPDRAAPTMEDHLKQVQLADQSGFSALWLRDVPFNVPSFGDAGQLFDPFTYLGFLAASTQNIALGVASVILPLRHPAHVAKAAASADQLSGGRLLLGVASGDRPEEYPVMNMGFEDRAERFRDSFEYVRKMSGDYPQFDLQQGQSSGGVDMLPKPTGGKIPLLVTGGSRQDPDWVAKHADGWITYPRDAASQARAVSDYRNRVQMLGGPDRPVTQSLYVDLIEDDTAAPHPIHLGFRSGVGFLRNYLASLRDIGVNHVAINLRFNQAPIAETMQRIAETLIPEFSTERDPS